MSPMRPLLITPQTRSSGPRRFPLRTLLLMILALLAFGRLWWLTHRSPPQRPARVILLPPQSPPAERP
jgi:hypothetical protein